jgi:hypothetical protein
VPPPRPPPLETILAGSAAGWSAEPVPRERYDVAARTRLQHGESSGRACCRRQWGVRVERAAASIQVRCDCVTPRCVTTHIQLFSFQKQCRTITIAWLASPLERAVASPRARARFWLARLVSVLQASCDPCRFFLLSQSYAHVGLHCALHSALQAKAKKT